MSKVKSPSMPELQLGSVQSQQKIEIPESLYDTLDLEMWTVSSLEKSSWDESGWEYFFESGWEYFLTAVSVNMVKLSTGQWFWIEALLNTIPLLPSCSVVFGQRVSPVWLETSPAFLALPSLSSTPSHSWHVVRSPHPRSGWWRCPLSYHCLPSDDYQSEKRETVKNSLQFMENSYITSWLHQPLWQNADDLEL